MCLRMTLLEKLLRLRRNTSGQSNWIFGRKRAKSSGCFQLRKRGGYSLVVEAHRDEAMIMTRAKSLDRLNPQSIRAGRDRL